METYQEWYGKSIEVQGKHKHFHSITFLGKNFI